MTEALKHDYITISDGWTHFDDVIAKFSQMDSQISLKAKIFHSPDFQSSICKIQNDKEASISGNEREKVMCFLTEKV